MEITIFLLVSTCLILFCYLGNESSKIYTQGVIKGKFTDYSSASLRYSYYLMVEYDYLHTGTVNPVKKATKVKVTKNLYDKVDIDVFFTVKVNL